MEWVLDASVAVAWAVPDETSKAAERFFGGLAEEDIVWVPALWWYEVSNALTMAQRRGRVVESQLTRFAELFRMLPVQTDTQLDAAAFWRFLTIAKTYELSAYDAAYLELAERRGIGLATLDQQLASAARRAGVRIASARG